MDPRKSSDDQREARAIYLVRGSDDAIDRDTIDVADVIARIWSRRWWVVALTVLAAALSVTYAMLAQPVYRAEVVLLPRDGQGGLGLSGQLSSLGGLAGLAGINLGGRGKQEPLGLLRSAGFARRFIEQNQLTDTVLGGGRAFDKVTGDPPDVRKATELFTRSIMKVEEEPKTGLVSLSIRWRDAEQAAKWANDLARQVNSEMRQRELSESETSLRYLTGELGRTVNVTLQQSIAKMIEAEMQRVLLTHRTDEVAFRVIDAAEVPRLRQWPKRTLIVIVGTILGFVLGLVAVVLADPFRRVLRAASNRTTPGH